MKYYIFEKAQIDHYSYTYKCTERGQICEENMLAFASQYYTGMFASQYRYFFSISCAACESIHNHGIKAEAREGLAKKPHKKSKKKYVRIL
jgi:hypothetical protein